MMGMIAFTYPLIYYSLYFIIFPGCFQGVTPNVSTILHHPPVASHSHRRPHGGALPSTRHRGGGMTRRVLLSGERRLVAEEGERRFVQPVRHSELTPMLGGLWTEAGRYAAVRPHLAEGAAGEICGTFCPDRARLDIRVRCVCVCVSVSVSVCVRVCDVSKVVWMCGVERDIAHRIGCSVVERRRGRARLVARTGLTSVPHTVSTEQFRRGFFFFPLLFSHRVEKNGGGKVVVESGGVSTSAPGSVALPPAVCNLPTTRVFVCKHGGMCSVSLTGKFSRIAHILAGSQAAFCPGRSPVAPPARNRGGRVRGREGGTPQGHGRETDGC